MGKEKEYEFCIVCKKNHSEGRRHVYSKHHQERLKHIISKDLKVLLSSFYSFILFYFILY